MRLRPSAEPGFTTFFATCAACGTAASLRFVDRHSAIPTSSRISSHTSMMRSSSRRLRPQFTVKRMMQRLSGVAGGKKIAPNTPRFSRASRSVVAWRMSPGSSPMICALEAETL